MWSSPAHASSHSLLENSIPSSGTIAIGHSEGPASSFVLEVERRQLAKLQRSDLSERVRWIADEDGDGAGYDILSFDASGRERLIEVKTTNGGANTPFFVSRNEYETAAARAESWRLYRVHLFAQTPRIFTISPPLLTSVHLRTETWRASFS